jgi:hypothetical protein
VLCIENRKKREELLLKQKKEAKERTKQKKEIKEKNKKILDCILEMYSNYKTREAIDKLKNVDTTILAQDI